MVSYSIDQIKLAKKHFKDFQKLKEFNEPDAIVSLYKACTLNPYYYLDLFSLYHSKQQKNKLNYVINRILQSKLDIKNVRSHIPYKPTKKQLITLYSILIMVGDNYYNKGKKKFIIYYKRAEKILPLPEKQVKNVKYMMYLYINNKNEKSFIESCKDLILSTAA